MIRSRTHLGALSLALSLACAPVARAAGPDSADALFNKGVEQMEAGHYDTACPAIEQSFKLDPLPGTLFTLAECEAKRGRSATAIARYDEYLAVYAKLSPEKKRKQADREKVSRDASSALAQAVPEITLTLGPGAPAGVVVTRDGAPVAATSLGVPMRLDPGDHVFTWQAPGGPAKEKAIALKPKDRTSLLLELPALAGVPVETPVSPPPEAPKQTGLSGRRIGAFAAFGVGGVGLVMGAITGGLALGKKSTVDQNCGIGGDPTACNHTGATAADGLKTLGTVSTVGFVLAGVGVGAGLALFFTEPKPQTATATRTRTFVGLSARGAVFGSAF